MPTVADGEGGIDLVSGMIKNKFSRQTIQKKREASRLTPPLATLSQLASETVFVRHFQTGACGQIFPANDIAGNICCLVMDLEFGVSGFISLSYRGSRDVASVIYSYFIYINKYVVFKFHPVIQ